MTHAQCIQFGLPRTPIKESERRRDTFEDRYGDGATELDALEALYPGRLAAIMRDALRPNWDTELDTRVEAARMEVEQQLRERLHAVVAPHRAEINAIRAEYDRLRADYIPQLNALADEFAPRLAALNEQYAPQLADLNEQLREGQRAMEEAIREDAEQLDPSDYPIPEAEEADEEGINPLYDSARDYDAQLDAYKSFQGRAANSGNGDAA